MLPNRMNHLGIIQARRDSSGTSPPREVAAGLGDLTLTILAGDRKGVAADFLRRKAWPIVPASEPSHVHRELPMPAWIRSYLEDHLATAQCAVERRASCCVAGTKPVLVLAIAVLGGVPGLLHADELPAPEGPVVLTVTGNINNTNSGQAALFDLALLESLEIATLETATSWTDGVPVFEGVWGRTLLEVLGAEGQVAVARALNDYVIEIPLSDLRELDVLIASKMNGRHLRIRDRGPLWVIYPWDQHPELDTEAVKQRSIWQLTELEIR